MQSAIYVFVKRKGKSWKLERICTTREEYLEYGMELFCDPQVEGVGPEYADGSEYR